MTKFRRSGWEVIILVMLRTKQRRCGLSTRRSRAALLSSTIAGNTTAANRRIGWARALKGRRDQVFLMTKVCTHGRDGSLGLEMLEQSLRRLQTDHLDLWQIHGVSFDNDPELFIRRSGAAEALEKAKQQGKVRFVGFTGHKVAGQSISRCLRRDFPLTPCKCR